jgi:3-oxoacyl-[acyl-carrier protein] reductase
VPAGQADLRNADEAGKVGRAVEESWGVIDTLVNNAAFSEAVPFIFIDGQRLRRHHGVEPVRLRFACAVRSVRGMIRQKYGRIVNISSITGSRSIAGPVHYAASKAHSKD